MSTSSDSMHAPAAITTVAVTGATGFVGRAIVAELVAKGYSVRALVRDREKARRTLPSLGASGKVHLVVGDVLDAANVLSGRRFDSGEAALWSEGDFTHDGAVDVLDAAELLSAGLFDAGGYLPSPLAVAPVPEPSGWLLGLAAAAAWVAATRRRARHDASIV